VDVLPVIINKFIKVVDDSQFSLQNGGRALSWINFLGVLKMFIIGQLMHNFLHKKVDKLTNFQI